MEGFGFGTYNDNTEAAAAGINITVELAEGEEIHPLLRPKVMECLFSNLPLQDLASCRLVCREWLSSSLKIWRSTTTTVINEYPNLDGVPLVDFLDFWDRGDCSLVPFRRFHLPSRGPKLSQLNGSRFWHQVGFHITDLTLEHYTFAGIDEFRNVLFRLCPNLRVLSMEECKVKSGSGGSTSSFRNKSIKYEQPLFGEHAHLKSFTLASCLPASWMEILSHFPLLTRLITAHPHLSSANLELLKAVQLIRERDNRKLPLKQFVVTLEFNPTLTSRKSFDLLRVLNLPLSEVNIFLTERKDHDDIRGILQHYSQTIRKIHGYGESGTVPSFEFASGLSLPNMKVFLPEDRFCEDLHFLKVMPNLEQLCVLDHLDEGVSHFQPHYLFSNIPDLDMELSSMSLPNLKELRVDFSVSEENLKQLVRFMPNVSSAEMVLNAEQFAYICEYWGELRELVIRGIGTHMTMEETKDVRNTGMLIGQTKLEKIQYYDKHFNLRCLSV